MTETATETTPLWRWHELVLAVHATGGVGGTADGEPTSAINGVSIDTRTIAPGDLFVALKDVRDGHDFVTAAFAKGAAAALVSKTYARRAGDGALLRVSDTLEALQDIGRARRIQSVCFGNNARVIAVTGSAGKTTTKEMLRACLLRVAPGRVHASEKSYNNHWGVPLTLARMPRDTAYAVFEIGMNHAGEITPLSKMVGPDVAVITTVEAVHLEHFGSVEAIADAKAEIFRGLRPNGTAVLKRSSPQFARLQQRLAEEPDSDARLVSFGLTPDADVHATALDLGPDGSTVTARIGGRSLTFKVAMPGRHIAENSLAVVAALDAIGVDLEPALAALADLAPPDGRGARERLDLPGGGTALLVDESYNANPASMAAAIATAAGARTSQGRLIAVLGDMLELGPDAPRLHLGLKDALDAARADLVFASGPNMRHLYDALEAHRRGAWGATSADIEAPLLAAVRAGDIIVVKGSNGSRMALLVAALKRHFGAKAPV